MLAPTAMPPNNSRSTGYTGQVNVGAVGAGLDAGFSAAKGMTADPTVAARWPSPANPPAIPMTHPATRMNPFPLTPVWIPTHAVPTARVVRRSWLPTAATLT